MKKRNCIIKKMWNEYTPYIQGGGWLIMMCAFVMTALTAAEKVQAFDRRLSQVESVAQRQPVVEEKLDLVIQLLRSRKD